LLSHHHAGNHTTGATNDAGYLTVIGGRTDLQLPGVSRVDTNDHARGDVDMGFLDIELLGQIRAPGDDNFIGGDPAQSTGGIMSFYRNYSPPASKKIQKNT